MFLYTLLRGNYNRRLLLWWMLNDYDITNLKVKLKFAVQRKFGKTPRDWQTGSSVARGGGRGGLEPPPLACEVCKNACFFVLLRPIFCEKWKIAPHTKIAPLKRLNLRNWEKNRPEFWRRPFFFFFLEITWFWAEKTFEFWISAEKSLWILAKTFFFFFFFFCWRSPDFGRKKR